jgi:hypothetical protein
MNKLLISLTACAFGLAMSSTAIAADPAYPEKNTSPQSTQSDAKAAPNNNPAGVAADKSTQSDPQAAPNTKPASVAADKKSKPEALDDAYSAELKKCDDLRGGEKQSCVDKVQGKYGKM